MMYTGHHSGGFTVPAYFPPLADTSMTFFDMPAGYKDKRTGSADENGSGTDENGNVPVEKVCTVEALTNRIDVLEKRLIQCDLLIPLATRMAKKLAALGQLSDAELKSAAQFGIDVCFEYVPVGIRRPVAMLDNHTGMDEQFLRLIGELKERKDFTHQFPEILEPRPCTSSSLGDTSMATLHRYNLDHEGLQSDESFFDVDTDEGYLQNFALKLQKFEVKNRQTNEDMQDTLAVVTDIKRLAIQIASAATETTEGRQALGARLNSSITSVSPRYQSAGYLSSSSRSQTPSRRSRSASASRSRDPGCSCSSIIDGQRSQGQAMVSLCASPNVSRVPVISTDNKDRGRPRERERTHRHKSPPPTVTQNPSRVVVTIPSINPLSKTRSARAKRDVTYRSVHGRSRNPKTVSTNRRTTHLANLGAIQRVAADPLYRFGSYSTRAKQIPKPGVHSDFKEYK